MALSAEDVREILRIIDESDLTELQIETEGFSLHVVKGERRIDAPAARPTRATPAAPEPESSAPAPTPTDERDGLVTIPAPMLGTFYRAEAPGAPPFVEVGRRVEPDT